MNATTNDFVDFYCLSDNKMRAAVSLVLVVMVFTMKESLIRAVKSFRTYKMNTGINEGVFIAMASGFSYRIRAMKDKKWTFVILAVFLLEVTPPFWNTLSTYAITTEDVFVKSPGSTTMILNGNINYGNGVENLRNVLKQILVSGASLLPSVAVYSNPQFSTLFDNKVKTSVVRDGYVTEIASSRSKNDFSFTSTDIVGTIITSCNTNKKTTVSFPDDGKLYVKKITNNQGLAVNVNSSYTTSGSKLTVQTEKSFISCRGIGNCNVTFTACETDIILAKQIFIYVTNSKRVIPIKQVDDNTTINILDFAEFTNVLINASEQVAYPLSTENNYADNSANTLLKPVQDLIDQIPLRKLMNITETINSNTIFNNYILDAAVNSGRSIGQGLFRNNLENELHARVCSAVSLTLFNLLETSTVNVLGTGDSISAFEKLFDNVETVDLYTVVTQAYMPTYFVWLIVAFFLVFVALFVIIDLVSFSMSEVNIKDNNELSLIDNIGNSMASERARHYLSNDANKQESIAFDNMMYVREEGTTPNKKILIEYNNYTGQPPNRSNDYF